MLIEINLYEQEISQLIATESKLDFRDPETWFLITFRIFRKKTLFPLSIDRIGPHAFMRCVLEMSRFKCLIHAREFMLAKQLVYVKCLNQSHKFQPFGCLTCDKCVCKLKSPNGIGVKAYPIAKSCVAQPDILSRLNSSLSLLMTRSHIRGLDNSSRYPSLNGITLAIGKNFDRVSGFITHNEESYYRDSSMVVGEMPLPSDSEFQSEEDSAIKPFDITDVSTPVEMLSYLKELGNPVYRDMTIEDFKSYDDAHITDTGTLRIKSSVEGLFKSIGCNNYLRNIDHCDTEVYTELDKANFVDFKDPMFLSLLFPSFFSDGKTNYHYTYGGDFLPYDSEMAIRKLEETVAPSAVIDLLNVTRDSFDITVPCVDVGNYSLPPDDLCDAITNEKSLTRAKLVLEKIEATAYNLIEQQQILVQQLSDYTRNNDLNIMKLESHIEKYNAKICELKIKADRVDKIENFSRAIKGWKSDIASLKRKFSIFEMKNREEYYAIQLQERKFSGFIAKFKICLEAAAVRIRNNLITHNDGSSDRPLEPELHTGYNLNQEERAVESQDIYTVNLPKKHSFYSFIRYYMNTSPHLLVGELGAKFISTLYDRFRYETFTLNNRYLADCWTTNGKLRSKKAFISMPSSLPQSNAYWYKKNEELSAMMVNFGCPFIFLTVTVNQDCPEMKMLSLVSNPWKDPVTLERVFDRLTKEFLRDVSIGKIWKELTLKTYWGRIEYQQRGKPHFHMFLWFKDLPEIGTDEWLTLVDRVATTDIDSVKNRLCMTDYDSLCQFQTHQHTPTYCLKTGKCRFNFPLPECEKSFIDGDSVTLKRKPEHAYIVDFSFDVYNHFKSHSNTKIVTNFENIKYLTAYACKQEPLQTVEVDYEAVSIQDSYKTLAKGQLVTTPEMSRVLLRLPFVYCPERFVKVQLFHPDRVLYSTKSSTVRGSWEKCIQTLIYLNRKDWLDNYNTYKFYVDNDLHDPDFPSTIDTFEYFYTYHEIEFRNKKLRVKRFSKPIILLYDQCSAFDELNYIFSVAIRDRVWESQEDFIASCDFPNEKLFSMGKFKQDNAEKFPFELYNSLLKLLSSETKDVHQLYKTLFNLADNAKDWKILRRDILTNTNPSYDIGTYPAAISLLNNSEYCYGSPENIGLLRNEKPRILSELLSLLGSSLKGHKVIIEGPAGTGKSFFLGALVGALTTAYPAKVLIAAPTGIAASHVAGNTIHSLLRIGIDMKFASSDDQMAFKDYIKLADILIIDEYSMIGHNLFTCIDKRLQNICDNTSYMGGKTIILMGDRNQLPPVSASSDDHLVLGSALNDYAIFSLTTAERSVCQNLNSLLKLSTSIDTKHKLMSIIKVLSKRRFIFNVSDGELYDLMANVLKQSILPAKNGKSKAIVRSAKIKSLSFNLKGNIRIVTPFQSERLKFEAAFMKLLNTKCTKFGTLTTRSFPGTARIFHSNRVDTFTKIFAIGQYVRVTRNLNIRSGLVNGAICKIVSFIDANNSIMVQLINCGDHIPIHYTEYTGEYRSNGIMVTAKIHEIPLEQSQISTVHKCQGLTLDSVIIDIRRPLFAHGMLYVCLSRVRRIEDIILIGDPSKLAYIVDSDIALSKYTTEYDCSNTELLNSIEQYQ